MKEGRPFSLGLPWTLTEAQALTFIGERAKHSSTDGPSRFHLGPCLW